MVRIREGEYYHTVAVRGASGVATDTPPQIGISTKQLMERLLSLNTIAVADIISVIFTMTDDLQSANPATILRTASKHSGYDQLPLLCAQEPHYKNSMARVIRVLLHVRVTSTQPLISVYINGAERLRPDL